MGGPVPTKQRGTVAQGTGARGTGVRARAVHGRGVPARHASHQLEGAADGRAAASLRPLDRRLRTSHWPSAGAAYAYMIGYLGAYYASGGGRRAGVGSDEHRGRVLHYGDVIDERFGGGPEGVAELAEPPDLIGAARDPDLARELTERARREAALRAYRAARTAEIERVASASGMSVADVTAVYDAHDDEAARRRLPPTAVIDPRGVGFLQTPVARTTRVTGGWLSYVMPFAGVYEAYYGVDAATGEQLSGAQRGLRAAIDLVPVALVATGAKIAVRAGLRAAGRLTARAATGIARLAARTGMHPRLFLTMLGRLARVARRSGRHVRSAYRKLAAAARSGGRAVLTRAERLALRDLLRSAGSGLRGARRAALRRAGRRLTAAQLERLRRVHAALPRYLGRRHKIALDDETVAELGGLFRSTRRSAGTYQEIRSASGELTVIEKVHAREATQTIEVLRPGQRAGDRTPDLRVTRTGGDRYHVEITTPTLARRAQRSPAREGAARQAPPRTKTRAPGRADIYSAFTRKIKHGQVSEANPGVIVVNVQRRPASGPMLTRRQVERLEGEIAGKPHIRELLIVAPTRAGRRVYRVGARDSGLGLADGALDPAAAAR